MIRALALVFAFLLSATAARADEETLALFAPFVEPNAEMLAWDELSNSQQTILLAVEDPNFWTHNGIDTRTPGAGITTITQALVKRLYFENFTKGPLNKLRQSRIAKNRVHPNVEKLTQLNAFLNLAYLGTGEGEALIGFQAASQYYFGKPVAELDQRAFVLLVGSLIGPNRWTPGKSEADERADRIERLLSGACVPRKNNDVFLEGCRK